MVDFVNNVRSFVNYAIFCELCDWMRSEVNCAKSHHRVISEGLHIDLTIARSIRQGLSPIKITCLIVYRYIYYKINDL